MLSSASVDYWNFRKDSIVNDEFVAEAELQKGTNLDANRRL